MSYVQAECAWFLIPCFRIVYFTYISSHIVSWFVIINSIQVDSPDRGAIMSYGLAE